MIKIAGLGIGVSNTVDDMKKECDIITKASCDEGAITEIVHNYIKNNLSL